MARSDKRRHQAGASHSISETAPKASLIMLLSGLFLLSAFTFFIRNSPSPAELAVHFAPAALLIGAVIGGLFCGARLKGGEGYASAILSTAIIAAMLLAARIFIPAPADRSAMPVTVIFHLLMVAAVTLGTFIANAKGKQRRRKKPKFRSKS